MRSDWDVVSLAEVYDFSSGLSKSRSEFGSGHPFLGFKDVFYNSAVPTELKELVQSTEKEQSKCSVKRGDVFLTRTSETMNELGMSCVALKDIPFATFNGFTKRLRPKFANSIIPEYSRYYFRSAVFREKVNAMATMSTRASLNNEILQRLEILLPPVSDQKAIGHILGTLDEKIALNRRTNETLEGIAKALFKSWFINFDPVRAKAEGHSTGLPDEISELFPDSFEDYEHGDIPKGWKPSCLSDVFSIQGGSQPPAKTFVEEQKEGYIRLLQIRDFSDDNHITYVPKTKNLRLVDEDDVLIGRYGSGNGKFMDDSLGRPLRGLSGAINVAVVKTLPKQKNMVELIYAMVSSGWFYRRIVGGTSRAVQAGFRKEDLDLIPFALPPNALLDLFQAIGSHCWFRCKSIDLENRYLHSLRDSLLPKLISGELSIPDAEKMIEEVGI